MALPAIPMALTTLNFVINPSKAAEALGMELLTGIGLSTQLGDFGAFFAVAAFLIGAGSLFMKTEYFKIAAFLFGSAALFRTIACIEWSRFRDFPYHLRTDLSCVDAAISGVC